MFSIDTKVQNPKVQQEVVSGFIGGLNTFQDQSLIRDNELTKAKNVVISVDGIEPRYGTAKLAGNDSDTAIYGALGYYKSDATQKLLRVSGARLKYYTGTDWSAVAATVIANLRTVLLQARDNVYLFNGSDALRYYDGSTIQTFTAMTTPVGLALTTSGSAGTTTYSYRISAFNAQGETLACAAVSIATGNAVLSASNYINVDWTATVGAVGYNIWGNKATGLGQTWMKTVYTNTYDDTGADTPSLSLLPPEGNSSAGISTKFACFAISRIFAAGDSANPSRLYWGGVGSNLHNFSSAPEGGGYVDVFKNDGAVIRAIIPFQGGVIVGKDNAIYKFSFTDPDGYPRLEEITRSFGMISHYATKHVENDIIFPTRKDGRLAFYSLGNQENYASSVLRTNELSIKPSLEMEDVNLARLNSAEGYYFRNLYICAVSKAGSTSNDRCWVLDTRFGAWVYWEGFDPSCFVDYTGTDGSQTLYYANSVDGYLYSMFEDSRDDEGVAFDVEFATKAFNQKQFGTMKMYLNPTFQFKGVSINGELDGDIILDGVLVNKSFTLSGLTTGGLGFGAMLFGFPLFGSALGGTPADYESSDLLRVVYFRKSARSIKYVFRSSTAGFYYKFISLMHGFVILTDKRLSSDQIIY